MEDIYELKGLLRGEGYEKMTLERKKMALDSAISQQEARVSTSCNHYVWLLPK